MITIDESILISALRETADGFAISTVARDRIASEARASEPVARDRLAPTLWRGQSRRRHWLTAAALLVAVAGFTWPLVHLAQPSTPSISASSDHGGVIRSHYGPAATSSAITRGGVSQLASGTGLQAPRAPSATSPDVTSSLSPKIESNGSIGVTVGHGRVEKSFKKLSNLATSDGGFVLRSEANVGSGASARFSYGTIVLQVPQRTFNMLVAQVQRVGHVTSIVTTSNDVTGQYVDLDARITALEASRRQYLQIMTRARSIGDILAVESQLNTLQSQLEQLQGQLHVLANATTYATLSVAVSEAGQQFNISHPRSGLGKAWHDAIGGFVAGVEWLIRISGPTLFAALCLSALLITGKFLWRLTRRRRIR